MHFTGLTEKGRWDVHGKTECVSESDMKRMPGYVIWGKDDVHQNRTSALNSQGCKDNKTPQTPGTRLDQPHGLDCGQKDQSAWARRWRGKVTLGDFIPCDLQDGHQSQVLKRKN